MGHLKDQYIKEIREKHPEYDCRIYIETGLFKGEQLVVSSRHFEVLHGIELDPHYFEVSKALVAKLPNVHVHLGDSRKVLPRILALHPGQPCFFYLDAHYFPTNPPIQKTEFPLWGELGIIKKRDERDIIVIDDTHVFGQVRPDLKFSETSVDWESVTRKSVLDFFGSQAKDSMEIEDAFVLWV